MIVFERSNSDYLAQLYGIHLTNEYVNFTKPIDQNFNIGTMLL